MTKFERVLSDACCMDILAKIDGFSATSEGEVYVGSGDDVWFQLAEFAERVEQAAIAKYKGKLAEQEPLAWYVDNDVTFDQKIAESWKKNLFIVKPLYENPSPSIVSDKTACISENGESETQAAHSPTKGLNLSERAAFEATMDGLLFDRADDGTYTSSVTRVALEAYQAGRADLQSPEIQALRKDAGRYRWLRDPKNDVALVLDKCTGYVPENEQMPGVGGYHTYEYRAGVELDATIDAARGQCQACDAEDKSSDLSVSRAKIIADEYHKQQMELRDD